jgi:hypothetical protein
MITSTINQGVLITSFIGHANYRIWTDLNEEIFTRELIPSLKNIGRLSFFTPMTCLDGYYIYPPFGGQDQSSTAEIAVRSQDIGAVASFSASGGAVASGHDLLQEGLFEAIFQDHIIQLGRATTLAKLYMLQESGGGHMDLIKDYLLFGDPFTMLQVPYLPDLEVKMELLTKGDILPGDRITYQITYSNVGNAKASGIILSVDLDPALLDPTFESSNSVYLRPDSGYIWDISELFPDKDGLININTQVSPNFEGILQSKAMITFGVHERNNQNNQSIANTVIGKFQRKLFFPVVSKMDDNY